MSRIGKNPISIPNGVKCNLLPGGCLQVQGKLGKLSFSVPVGLDVILSTDSISIKPNVLPKNIKMMWGTARSLICNMVKGVNDGFVKCLEINGVGYKSSVSSGNLVLSLGYSHDINYKIPDGIKIVCKKPTLLEVSGIDYQLVGQVASKIRSFRKPEPYKGKGIKYSDEVIFRKEGKKK